MSGEASSSSAATQVTPSDLAPSSRAEYRTALLAKRASLRIRLTAIDEQIASTHRMSAKILQDFTDDLQFLQHEAHSSEVQEMRVRKEFAREVFVEGRDLRLGRLALHRLELEELVRGVVGEIGEGGE